MLSQNRVTFKCQRKGSISGNGYAVASERCLSPSHNALQIFITCHLGCISTVVRTKCPRHTRFIALASQFVAFEAWCNNASSTYGLHVPTIPLFTETGWLIMSDQKRFWDNGELGTTTKTGFQPIKSLDTNSLPLLSMCCGPCARPRGLPLRNDMSHVDQTFSTKHFCKHSSYKWVIIIDLMRQLCQVHSIIGTMVKAKLICQMSKGDGLSRSISSFKVNWQDFETHSKHMHLMGSNMCRPVKLI